MDIRVIVAAGQYSIEVCADGTDALAIPDTLHNIAEHLQTTVQIPAVAAAMALPSSLLDDEDD